jgi:plastocyanin
MKRSLMAIVATGAVAVEVAGVSGAFSAGHGGSRTAVATPGSSSPAHTPMPMPMPSTSTGSPGPLRLERHQRVIRVKIMNFAFLPARIEVSPGTRVVWTNEDSDPHTVTTDRPGFSSQALDTGQAYANVLTKAGTFAYHCTIHPFMHGTVIVDGRAA